MAFACSVLYMANPLVSPESHSEGKDNRIPLLKEVFEAFPQTPVNIDIKMNNNVLIRKVRVKVWG